MTGIHSGRILLLVAFFGRVFILMMRVLQQVDDSFSASILLTCTKDEATGKAFVTPTWLVSRSLVRYVYMGKPRSSLKQIQSRFRFFLLKIDVKLFQY